MPKYRIDVILKDIETKRGDFLRDVTSRIDTRDIVIATSCYSEWGYYLNNLHRDMQVPKIRIYRNKKEISEEELRSDYNIWWKEHREKVLNSRTP